MLDLIDVAGFLADQGWATPGQTVAVGAPHGGLVVAAASLLAPAAFSGVIPVAPLLDAVNLAFSATVLAFAAPIASNSGSAWVLLLVAPDEREHRLA